MRADRTDQSTLAALREQVDFMLVSARRFDEGALHESKRLAAQVRILLHQTRSSHALLESIGIRQSLRWMDLAQGGIAPGAHFGESLVRHVFDGTLHSAIPPMDPEWEPAAPFEDWWHMRVLVKNRVEWTRARVVLDLANQEGGAHVDPRPQVPLTNLQTQGMGWVLMRPGEDSLPLTESPLPYVMRSISHEVLITLMRQAPDLALLPGYHRYTFRAFTGDAWGSFAMFDQ